MTHEDTLGAIAGELNDVPETAARSLRHLPLVTETNMLIREAANDMIHLDSTPLSFAALKTTCVSKA
jgi:DNA polymerase III delta prime subunit